LENGDGLLLDIVPNHMAASSENPWWMECSGKWPDSAFSSYFDIDWHPPSRNLDNKILLSDTRAALWRALDSGEFKLTFRAENLPSNILNLPFAGREPTARSWDIASGA